MSFNPHESLTRTISLRKDYLANPTVYFLNNPFDEIQSFRLLGLTISHDLSWAKGLTDGDTRRLSYFNNFIFFVYNIEARMRANTQNM